MTDIIREEYTLNCDFKFFKTTVTVVFNNTKDIISECQNRNYEGFISKQDELVPDILNQIFEYYKESYSHYYKGWSFGNWLTEEQIEESLPTPTNAENLKKYIEPLSVYIADKEHCEEGTFGIYFDCTWDINNSLGVVIKEWKVFEAGTGDRAFLH